MCRWDCLLSGHPKAGIHTNLLKRGAGFPTPLAFTGGEMDG